MCRIAVDQLLLPPRADLALVRDRVVERVGHLVITAPMSMGGAASGMTLTTDDAHIVLYETDTSAWHQRHIVMHEYGHLLMGHEKEAATTEAAVALWAPTLDAGTVMRHMGIAPDYARYQAYARSAELEAEIIATLLMERTSPTLVDEAPLDGEAARIAAQVLPALQHLRSASYTMRELKHAA